MHTKKTNNINKLMEVSYHSVLTKNQKKKKKKHNIKNRKLNCSLQTKKTNNTNKLMQISYHSAFTKIQKLQN